jgi:hypothetical protein
MGTSKSQIIRAFSLWAALVMLMVLTVACNARLTPSPAASGQAGGQMLEQNAPSTPEFDTMEVEPDRQISPGDLAPREQSDCPDLDSLLFQITQAPDPIGLAEQLPVRIREDKVQVLLLLDREDTGFLRDFGVEIGTQSGTQVQAFVPVSQLCDLANTDEVLAIRLPAQAAPQ